MRPKIKVPFVKPDTPVKEVLLKITKMRAGSASVIGRDGKLLGIFTDGDLRRHFDKGVDLLNAKVGDVMTRNPYTITSERMAAEAFKILSDKKIDEIPVVDKKGKMIGLLDVQDILKEGLV
jgi:arabinose-5-phosphate isomerase